MDHGQTQAGAGTVLWGTIVISFFNALPGILSALAALAGIAWSLLMIYESTTVQAWLRRHGSRWALPQEKIDE